MIHEREFAALLGDAPRLARVLDTDAHEGPVYSPDEDALYFTSVPRPGSGPGSPHTVLLSPGLSVEKVYVGYWFWGRPSRYRLWDDLTELTERLKEDYDPTVPEVRAKLEEAQRAAV